MKIAGRNEATGALSDFDFLESYKKQRNSQVSDEAVEAAQKEVAKAKDATLKTTFDMMDKHHETVKKSQELQTAQAKKNAIKRQNEKRRDEHSELLAEMALRNAERSDRLRANWMKENLN